MNAQKDDNTRTVTGSDLFVTQEDLSRYFASQPALVGVMIHVVGPPEAPFIIVQPNAPSLKQQKDYVSWAAGANCGDWEVAFKGASPLDPPGPFSSLGPTGGKATGALGVHPYSVQAVDLRTGNPVSLDPEIIIIPT